MLLFWSTVVDIKVSVSMNVPRNIAGMYLHMKLNEVFSDESGGLRKG